MKFGTLTAAALVLACSGGNGGLTGPGDAPPAPLSYVSLASPVLVQPITADDMQAGRTYRFVEVEVAEVVNSRRHALSFDVHYEPPGGQRIALGSFSLYPPDNPGRFIVPTQNRVRNEGAIVLTMTSPDTDERTPEVRVGVRRMRFTDG